MIHNKCDNQKQENKNHSKIEILKDNKITLLLAMLWNWLIFTCFFPM